MARTELTVQDVDRSGLTPAYVSGDATNEHSFDNTSQAVFVHIKNGGGGGINATFITSQTVDGNAVADLVIAVGAGAEAMVGPFRNDLYGQADAGNNLDTAVLLDLDTDTSVTLGAFKLGDVNF
jgi:hypothetical protein